MLAVYQAKTIFGVEGRNLSVPTRTYGTKPSVPVLLISVPDPWHFGTDPDADPVRTKIFSDY